MKIKFFVFFFSLFVFSFCAKAQTTTSTNDSTNNILEVLPQFPGGNDSLFAFLERNLHYPPMARQLGKQGTVIVNFCVDSTGKITNLLIKKPLGSGCDEEALRVVNLLPNFSPGIQNGKAVNVYINLPINFKLNSSSKTKKNKN